MSFNTYTDHWALVTASTAALEINGDGNPKSIPVNETAKDDEGNVIARGTVGGDFAPSNSFGIKAAIAALEGWLFLGDVKGSSQKNLLTSFTVKTGIETEPTLEVSGVSVQSAASVSSFRKVTLPAIAVACTARAQILAGAFTLGGEGCEVNECSLTGKINPTLFKPAGVVVGYDFGGAELEVVAKIVQSAAAVPTITPAEGWKITSGPSKDPTKTGYDMWSVTLVLDVDGTDPVA